MVSQKAKLISSIKAIDDIEGEGFFSDMASKVRQYLNPNLTSKGIYSTESGMNINSSRTQLLPQQTPNEQPLEKQGYFKTLLYGRNNFPPAVRAILKKHGDKRIIKAVVIRQPVMSFNTKLLNLASMGAFQASLDKQPYDTLFHLRSVITLEDNVRVQVEKSEVIHIDTKITVVKGQEEQEVDLPQEPLTINKMLEGAKGILKGNMYTYDGFKNNCQDFQLALYRGSDLLDEELKNFIKQDVSEIAESSPVISKLANFVTGLGGKFNEFIHGEGVKLKTKIHSITTGSGDLIHIDLGSHNALGKSKMKMNGNGLHKLNSFTNVVPNQKHIEGEGLIDTIVDFIKSLSKNKNPNPDVDYNPTRKVRGRVQPPPPKIYRQLYGEATRNHTGYGLEGGALELDAPDLRTTRVNWSSKINKPVQSYKPLDMKLKTDNAMLNNLKKSDLEDLMTLKQQAKRSLYDREKSIKAIKAITKKRVKTEVKSAKTAKPKNLKTRGSLESRKKALSKFTFVD